MEDKSKDKENLTQSTNGAGDSNELETKPNDSSLTSTPPNPNAADRPTRPGMTSRLKHLVGRHNFYLLVLAALVSIALVGILLSVRASRNNNSKGGKASSLTDQQLSELKGSTTVVGDPQQILDVQSNAVFEGQILVRKNLDVAGSIKIGGPLSLSSVTVGGTSTFGNVAVGGNLTVAGVTTLQGSFNLQRNISVAGSASFKGTVSAGKVSTDSLQLTGDLQLNRHITLGGGVPAKTNGTAVGGGGTASVNGSDVAGTITINTGGGPPAGCFVTISFTHNYNAVPHVVISPSNSKAAGLNYYTNRSVSGFSVCTLNAPSAASTYLFDYIVIE
jgi:cytoskeletal protein CcmA (bactofilin family)